MDILVAFAEDAHWGLFDHVQMQHERQAPLGRNAVERSENWLRRPEILNTDRVLFSVQEATYAEG